MGSSDSVSCMFEVAQRGAVVVTKTESGEPPAEPFAFEVRADASLEERGLVLATGQSDADGTVAFACMDDVDPAVCLDETSLDPAGAHFPAGAYQLCEISVLPGWFNDLDGFLPAETDGSTFCADIALDPGSLLMVVVDNTPPPGGFAHPPEFWRNWSSCGAKGDETPVLDETLAMFHGGGAPVGDVFIDGCPEAVELLGGNALDGASRSGDIAYSLAAALLAAQLNEQAGALTCALFDVAVEDASGLLSDIGFDGLGPFLEAGDNPGTATAAALETTLDLYNSNQLCERPDEEAAPDLLVPFLIWPAILIAGRIGRHRTIHGLCRQGEVTA